MKGRTIQLAVFFSILIGASGCATTMTLMSPMTSEVVVAEKRPGVFKQYAYEYRIRSGTITLMKTAMCNEVAKSVRVERKRTIGYGPAMLEMAFFGLGLVDIASASAISDASRRIYPVADSETGKQLACGDPEPAAGEMLIFESSRLTAPRTAVTDASGRIDLEALIGRPGRAIPLTIRLASDQSVTFTCLYKTPGANKPSNSDLAMR